MRDILRDHYVNELNLVHDSFAILRPFADNESFKAKMTLLQSNIEALNRDIAKRKEHKFPRDAMAINNGRAYKWKKTDENITDREKEKDRNTNLRKSL